MLRKFVISVFLVLAQMPLMSAAAPPGNSAAVREALRYGFADDPAEQRRRLNQLLQTEPDLIVARGHAGYVRQGQAWIDYAEFTRQPTEVARLADYQAVRQAAPDTLEGHWELANWCQQRELEDQERAHLHRVLEFDADHAAARSRLEFVKQDGEWVSRREQRAADLRQREQLAALQKWRPQIRTLVTSLSRKHGGLPDDVRERKKILAKLATITDPAAVPALTAELTAYLNTLDEQPGSSEHKIADVLVPLVRAIGRIPHPQAAESLARIATECALTVPMELTEAFVMEDSGPRFLTAAERDQAGAVVDRLTRELAAVYRELVEQLKQRPRDSFVPLLLSGLSSPVQGEYLTYRERDGDVVVRLFYLRETEARGEGRENRTTFQPQGAQAAKARASALSGQRAWQQIQSAHQQLQQVNRDILQRNLRVTDLLRDLTEQSLSPSPQSWWDWWNEENEVHLSGDKQIVAKVYKQTVAVIAPPPPPPASRANNNSRDDRKKDCLAAGTLIWTASGLVPIERLAVGDLVLAQHPETGELAYRPVLRTTVRPPGRLVKLDAGGVTYRTSGGHPFWVVGEGWVRARQLQAGRKIYGLGGAVAVEQVENSDQSEPTYNLIVADFHSYFVGPSRIFSHDNTVRHPTGMAVPGVPRTVAEAANSSAR